MNVFGIPTVVDNRVPKNRILLMPDDVKAAIDLCEAGAIMVKHGILTEEFYKELFAATLSYIRKAAREQRTAVIKL